MVSGWHLAEFYKKDIQFIWPFESICLDDAHEIFETKFYSRYFIQESETLNLLTFSQYRDGINLINSETILIKGGKKGEQFYINYLARSGKSLDSYKYIYIVSGGIFHPVEANLDINELENKRKTIYRSINFNQHILEEVSALKSKINDHYLGIHLRYSDLMASAPSMKTVIKTIIDTSNKDNIKNVYIASDNGRKKEYFQNELQKNNIRTFIYSSGELKRGKSNANTSAIIDWLMLVDSIHLIHTNSSYGKEAIVYSNNILKNTVIKSSQTRYILTLPLQLFYVMWRKLKSVFTFLFFRIN